MDVVESLQSRRVRLSQDAMGTQRTLTLGRTFHFTITKILGSYTFLLNDGQVWSSRNIKRAPHCLDKKNSWTKMDLPGVNGSRRTLSRCRPSQSEGLAHSETGEVYGRS